MELNEPELANFAMDDWRRNRAWLQVSNVYPAGSTQQVPGPTGWITRSNNTSPE